MTCPGADARPRPESLQLINMDIESFVTQWRGKAPPGFVPHAAMPAKTRPRCARRRSKSPIAVKKNADFAKS